MPKIIEYNANIGNPNASPLRERQIAEDDLRESHLTDPAIIVEAEDGTIISWSQLTPREHLAITNDRDRLRRLYGLENRSRTVTNEATKRVETLKAKIENAKAELKGAEQELKDRQAEARQLGDAAKELRKEIDANTLPGALGIYSTLHEKALRRSPSTPDSSPSTSPPATPTSDEPVGTAAARLRESAGGRVRWPEPEGS